jgi:D-tyrosyl-tRNA(Tyr) deacylase
MRAVIQRVTQARVTVDGQVVAEIGNGLLVLVGIKNTDTEHDREYLINKIVSLRLFPGDTKPIDKNVVDAGGQIVLVSQFTLYGDCTKGNRPSFSHAMEPEAAAIFYDAFVHECTKRYSETKSGIFRAHMQVQLINDGPVTVIVDSDEKNKIVAGC